MKLKIDNQADALYLTLDESEAVESEEVSPGIIIDYNADNHVIGIEMLYLSKRSPMVDTGRLLFEMVQETGPDRPSDAERRGT
jgi:uncharacterized protein YuzE